jgi:putative acetyltransferase
MPVASREGKPGNMATMAATMIQIRDYDAKDASEIAHLFYETVREVNRADYSPEQVQAWAPEVSDLNAWHARMSGRCTVVAEEDGKVVAFAD